MPISSSRKARTRAPKMRSRWWKRFECGLDANRGSSWSTKWNSGAPTQNQRSRRKDRHRLRRRSNSVKEQIMPQKMGNRTGMGKGKSSVGQRPAKRDREPGASIAVRLRSLVGYVPLALRIGLIAILGLVALVGYRAAASADFF